VARDLLEATDGARVDLKFADLDGIGAAGGEDWRARAWRLERLFPGEFGRQTKHQHTGPEGGPIGIEVGDALGDLGLLSEEGLDQLAKLMAITHGRGHSGKR
jgi:hypothetical protein